MSAVVENINEWRAGVNAATVTHDINSLLAPVPDVVTVVRV